MSAREIIAYAITHAPKGVKGGPYWAERGGRTSDIRLAMRFSPEGIEAATNAANHAAAREDAAWLVRCDLTARIVRIVRKARPSRLCDACGFLIEAESRRRAPSEASAVEVLRELVAWDEDPPMGEHDIVDICARARRVLAASGPDPSEVVRAAMAWSEATGANGTARTVALQLACVAYRKAGGK